MLVCNRFARKIWRLHARASLCAFGLLVGLALIASPSAANESAPATRAAHQLVAAQLPSGLFAFEHDFLLGGQRPGSQLGMGRVAFITRQAGTAYMLSSYYPADKDPAIARAIVATLHRLQNLSLPIAKASGQEAIEWTGILGLPFGRYKLHDTLEALGLLYRPHGDGWLVTYDRSYETAWGATTAFALLTELQFYRATHDPEFAAARRAWLKGLLVLYDGRGGFRTLPDEINEDAMSNAEIWLALADYTALFPNDRSIAAMLANVDDAMLKAFSTLPNANSYSWGVKAAARRFETTSDAKFLPFIAEQTRVFLAGVGPLASSSDNSCADVEGLATALRVLSAHEDRYQDLVGRLRQRIAQEMTKNLSLQIKPGQTRIDLGNASFLSSPSVADYAGAFLAGTHEPYSRIDYTAHCISALLLLGETKP